MTPFRNRLTPLTQRMAEDMHVRNIPFGKRPKKLPLVLGHEQATRLIECATNLKHQTVLLTPYAAGLRLSEATHLQVANIDSSRMQLSTQLAIWTRIIAGPSRQPQPSTSWLVCQPPSHRAELQRLLRSH